MHCENKIPSSLSRTHSPRLSSLLTIAAGILSIMAMLLITSSGSSAQTFSVPMSSPSTFWGQEVLNASVPSTYGSIRTNGTAWNSLESSWYSFSFSSLDTFHTRYCNTANGNCLNDAGPDLLFTWFRTPDWAQSLDGYPVNTTLAPAHEYSAISHVNTPSDKCHVTDAQAGANPTANAANSTTGDCYVKEFWIRLMEHVCSSSTTTDLTSVPSAPLKTCWIRNYELWNEFNVGGNNAAGYWNDSAANLAQMGVDASKIIRLFCADCRISLGSTSGGGAGYSSTGDISDPNGKKGYVYYDTAIAAVLDAWHSIPNSVMPDFVSWHPYATHLTYTLASGQKVPIDPAPFPETAVSGDGAGNDTGDGSGSEFHTGSAYCKYPVANEYTSTNCGDSVNMQATKLLSMEANHYMLQADGVTPKPLWATEGGFGNYYDMQGTVAGNNGLTSRDYLRGTYMGRWLLVLAAQGVARVYPYSYDTNHNSSVGSAPADAQCWMLQEYTLASTDCLADYPNAGSLGGDSYTGETYSAGVAIGGVAWNNVEAWLNGASKPVCTQQGSNWSCQITRTSPAGYHATIYWNDAWNAVDSTFQPTPPSGKHFTQYRYLLSTSGPVIYSNGTVHLAGEPLIFEGIN